MQLLYKHLLLFNTLVLINDERVLWGLVPYQKQRRVGEWKSARRKRISLRDRGINGINEEEEVIEERFRFKVFSPEEEPKLKPKMRLRAKKAVKSFAAIQKIEKKTQINTSNKPKDPKAKKAEKEKENCQALDNAAKIGRQLLPKILLPAMPALLQDLWVYTEIGITLYQFVSSATEVKKAIVPLKLVAFILATINVILGLIDAFLYLVQMGSCARFARKISRKLRGETDPEEDGEEEAPKKERCHCLSQKWKERFEMWFEIMRSILSELLLYPLLILDIIDFVTGSPYLLREGEDRNSVAFFSVGTFYFVLGVYLMRIFMLFSTIAVMTRLPLDLCNSQKETTAFVISFAITALGQMASQIAIVVAIGTKLKQENPIDGTESGNVHLSPFLWCAIVLGALIPNFSLLAYFLVNYFSFKGVSVGFFINMMSLLQSESFAEVAFSGEAGEKPIEKAEELAEKLNLSKTKQTFNQQQQSAANTWAGNLLASVRMPVLVGTGVVYYITVVAFLVCLVYTQDSRGDVHFVLFRSSGLCIAFFMVGLLILVTNMYSLFMIHVWMLLGLGMAVVSLAWTLLCCVWSPVGAVLGAFYHLKEIAKDVEVI